MKEGILKVVLACLFIAIFAQISLHLDWMEGGIPITGQTYAVLLVAYLLGGKTQFYSLHQCTDKCSRCHRIASCMLLNIDF